MTDFGVRTDKGRVRKTNEDSYGTAPELNLFVLSDGMGGLECGEVASRITVDTIIGHCRMAADESSVPFAGMHDDRFSETTNRLASAVRAANAAVQQASLERAMENGMGATAVAVQFNGHRMSVANVGDSRVYRLRGGSLEQLTQDHSFVAEQVRQGKMTEAEAAASNYKNVLIRALGVEPEVAVDMDEVDVADGDTILLCSDGLTRDLSDAQIAGLVGETVAPQQVADRLVTFANDAGGGDNITVIVVRPSFGAGNVIERFFQSFKGPKRTD